MYELEVIGTPVQASMFPAHITYIGFNMRDYAYIEHM